MVKLSTKLLPLIGVFLLLSAIGFFLIKSERKDVAESILDKVVPAEGAGIENFKGTLIDPDKDTVWGLEADKAYQKDKIFLLEGFRLKFQPKDGLDFELEGKHGEINREKNEINLSGELKGKTHNGYVLYAEQLMIQMKENYLKSDGAVTFIGPFFKITGKGLFLDLEKETFKILKDVNSTFDKESLII